MYVVLVRDLVINLVFSFLKKYLYRQVSLTYSGHIARSLSAINTPTLAEVNNKTITKIAVFEKDIIYLIRVVKTIMYKRRVEG